MYLHQDIFFLQNEYMLHGRGLPKLAYLVVDNVESDVVSISPNTYVSTGPELSSVHPSEEASS